MNIFKKLVLIAGLSSFVAQPAIAMEPIPTNNQIPHEVLVSIFNYLGEEVLTTLFVCKQWFSAANNDLFWCSICKSLFGDNAKKNDTESWSDYYHRLLAIIKDLQNIENWPSQKIEFLIKNSGKLEHALLRICERTLLAQPALSEIKSTAQLAAFFLAFTYISAEASGINTRSHNLTFENNQWDFSNSGLYHFIKESALSSYASNLDTSEVAKNSKDILYEMVAPKSSTFIEICSTFSKNPWQVKQLRSLAYLGQKECMDKCFLPVFFFCAKAISADGKLRLSKDEIISSVSRRFKYFTGTTFNLYLASLEYLIKTLAEQDFTDLKFESIPQGLVKTNH